MMAVHRRILVALSVLVLLSCSMFSAEAALMTLERYAQTVAGQLGMVGKVNGLEGTSLFESGAPLAMCAYPSIPAITDTFLVGDVGSFRSFNRTTGYLGSYTNITYNSASASPYGCVTATFGTVATTYFVTNSPMIGYITSAGAQGAIALSNTGFLAITVDPLQNYLYALSQQAKLFRCTITDATPIITGSCTEIIVTGGTWPTATSNTYGGVAVTSTHIFIATGASVNVYTLDGTLVTTTGTTANYRDVHLLSNTLYAVTNCVVYNMSFDGAAVTVVAISPTTTCGVENGLGGSFRRIYKVYPINQDEIYVSINTDSVLRSLTVPPMNVAYAFARPPFPLGFGSYEDNTLIPQLYNYMDVNLQNAVGAGTMVDPDTVSVEPTLWVTNMTVEVPQRVFDTDTTEPTVETLPYTQTADLLSTYYNRTNELVYADANLLPLCSVRQMRLIEHAVAAQARVVLNFPLIYTGTALTPVASNPNITALKLLMPADFGYGNVDYTSYNATTHPLLANSTLEADSSDFSNRNNFFVSAVRSATPTDRQYVVQFDQPPVSISRLSAEQRAMLRLLVQHKLEQQLALCQAQCEADPSSTSPICTGTSGAGSGSGSDSGSGASGSGQISSCTSHIGISNMSQPYATNYTYDVFIPDGLGDGINITACLDGTDWTDIINWVNTQPQPSHRKCDTGCIVGIAVAAAVVAAFLIVLIVVLTSKRKRLATVVAPGAASAAEPKFVSTYDDDDDGRNPLDD